MVKCQYATTLGNKAEIILFAGEDVDGGLVQNAGHGLGMNFVRLFDIILPMILETQIPRKPLRDDEVILGKGEMELVIDYRTLRPVWKLENSIWIEANKNKRLL